MTLSLYGWEAFSTPGAFSPTQRSLGPSHQWHHKFWVSLWEPLCAHGLLGIPHEEVSNRNNTLHMYGYYVAGGTPISCPGYRCIIMIVSKEKNIYLVSITYFLKCMFSDFAKLFCLAVGKNVSGFHANTCITYLRICARFNILLTISIMQRHLATMRWCVFLSSHVLQNNLSGIGMKGKDTIIPHFYIYRIICI